MKKTNNDNEYLPLILIDITEIIEAKKDSLLSLHYVIIDFTYFFSESSYREHIYITGAIKKLAEVLETEEEEIKEALNQFEINRNANPFDALEKFYGVTSKEENLQALLLAIREKYKTEDFGLIIYKEAEIFTFGLRKDLNAFLDDSNSVYNPEKSLWTEYFTPMKKENSKFSNSHWWGQFASYRMAEGQAEVIKRYKHGERLIAVQGPPGTGKTTLIMNIIACCLTSRAEKLIELIGRDTLSSNDWKSVKFFSAITSIANKAVENVLEKIGELKSAHSEINYPWLMLYTINTKQGKGNIAQQIETFIDKLENCSFDQEEALFDMAHFGNIRDKLKERIEQFFQCRKDLEEKNEK